PGITDLRHPASGIRNPASGIRNPEYYQVFADRHGFLHDLSIVDLLFNIGPETSNYLDLFL
ncbi:MAG: WbqC family protein, partial [Bacteroidales bacterium]|nr:WbqC family protein [Bacteroidales bacterium]